MSRFAQVVSLLGLLPTLAGCGEDAAEHVAAHEVPPIDCRNGSCLPDPFELPVELHRVELPDSVELPPPTAAGEVELADWCRRQDGAGDVCRQCDDMSDACLESCRGPDQADPRPESDCLSRDEGACFAARLTCGLCQRCDRYLADEEDARCNELLARCAASCGALGEAGCAFCRARVSLECPPR